ncbi:rifin [Plasmodium reichenowi]|uniref:Rifin n=1 Tax=Plasmodium reichenowi TaxID=5854 RepID=A0A060RQ34_PLARE|nr:rifin [Plasmodium reichenowi]
MKANYVNILLFALPLNILAHNKNKPYSTPQHTKSNRSLCECDLYAPANYDNDPQMKGVMQQFEDRTSQRLLEYDERMKNTRQKCKDKCDKEIQKIILKDKLEKQMAEKFATLDTDIQSDAIPTCICETSIANKVEKGCLRCGGVLGGGVAPSVGLLGGIGIHAWKIGAPAAAEAAAKIEAAVQGAIEGNAVGMNFVNSYLENMVSKVLIPDLSKKMSSIGYYADVTKLSGHIVKKYNTTCSLGCTNVPEWMEFKYNVGILIEADDGSTITQTAEKAVQEFMESVVRMAKKEADIKTAQVIADKTPIFTTRNIDAVNTAYGGCQTSIIASVVAIVVIVLIMVIIYKILRYRRKKKMKKKLQYIKLLEE